MKTILERKEISDIVSVGAEFSKEDNEVMLYVSTPEISVSMSFEENEWGEFRSAVQEIDEGFSNS